MKQPCPACKHVYAKAHGYGFATGASAPQLVRLEESREAEPLRMIEIRYGEAELKLPEDVDLKAVAVLLSALCRHD